MGKGKGTFWTTLCCLLPWYASAFLASDDFYSKANQSQSVHQLLHAHVYHLAVKSMGQ